MVTSEYLQELRSKGIELTESALRHAIKSRRLAKPRLDGAHRFDFTQNDVDAAVELFKAKSGGSNKQEASAVCQ